MLLRWLLRPRVFLVRFYLVDALNGFHVHVYDRKRLLLRDR